MHEESVAGNLILMPIALNSVPENKSHVAWNKELKVYLIRPNCLEFWIILKLPTYNITLDLLTIRARC